MGTTHLSLAYAAFRKALGRDPVGSNDRDAAWLRRWVADYVGKLVREKPGYDRYHALKQTRRAKKIARSRQKKVAPGSNS
jgi:prophage antirepressor-like protein